MQLHEAQLEMLSSAMELLKYGGGKEVFCCMKDGCQRRFDIVQGYHNVVKGQIKRDGTARRCREHEVPTFLRQISLDGAKGIWICSQLDCEYSDEVANMDEDERKLTEEIRQYDVEIDVACMKLAGTARAVVGILDELMQGVTTVSASLESVGMPWAQVQSRTLLEAVRQAKINRGDREGKILLSLPGRHDDEAAHRKWLRSVRLVDENQGMLAAAGRYGLARLGRLKAVVREVAGALSTVEHPEAHACATRLLGLDAESVQRAANRVTGMRAGPAHETP
jgi:hypothetical protein